MKKQTVINILRYKSAEYDSKAEEYIQELDNEEEADKCCSISSAFSELISEMSEPDFEKNWLNYINSKF